MYALIKSELSRGIQFFTYPLLLLTGLTIYFLMIEFGANNFLASTLPVFICLAIILLLEFKFPYRKDWNANLGDIKSDISFLIIVQGVAPRILGLAAGLLLVQSGIDQEALGAIWPGHWSIPVQTALMILLADLLRYWLHVAAHRIPFLWKFHAIHHQPKKLYSVNVARFHPTEKATQFLFDTLPFILIGVSAEVIACYFVFYAINGFVQHSNINLRFGVLNYIISTSELHRWHHNEDQAVANCNYGNNLIIWDLIFGSFYLPAQKTSSHVGIKDVEPSGFLDALRQPFNGMPSLARLKKWVLNQAIHLLYKFARINYWKAFEKQCLHPAATQDQLLQKIIARQSATTFGRNHCFASIKNYQDFRQYVDIQDYEDLRPLFEKQARQGSLELTSAPAILYAQTSGSTGNPKYIPVTGQSMTDLRKSQTLSSLMIHQACPQAFNGKILGIVSPAEEGYNEWGKLCGSASGLILKNMPAITRKKQLLPSEVFDLESYELKYDLILLLALAEEDISFIGTANPSTLLHLVNLVNARRDYYLEALSGDYRRLRERNLNQAGQNILAKIKCPATRLRSLGELFATHREISYADLWPGLRMIMTWTGGSCGIPLDTLTKNLPKSCQVMELGFIASEFRGTITHSDTQLGMPTLHENFFEFVEKEKWENGASEFLRLHEIQENHQYYIFITNLNGLYRYDINDIVEVSGRFKNTPCFKFVQKGKGTTSITGEKLYEAHLCDAINELGHQQHVHPVFYVCLANERESRYELFLETGEAVSLPESKISSIVDRSLSGGNLEYRAKRDSGRLKKIEVRLLKTGSCEMYKRTLIDQGQRECQFKVMTLQYASNNSFDFKAQLLN